MNETNIKYYKTYRGIYKIDKNVLEKFEINQFDYVIHKSKDNYSLSFLEDFPKYIEKCGGKEITEEEYNKIYITFDFLQRRQEVLINNIKEFIQENLNE